MVKLNSQDWLKKNTLVQWGPQSKGIPCSLLYQGTPRYSCMLALTPYNTEVIAMHYM